MRISKLPKWTGLQYIVLALLGSLLTPITIKLAFIERGYPAAGGELLLPILFVVAAALRTEIRGVINEVKEEWR